MQTSWETQNLLLKPATQGVIADIVEIEKKLKTAGFVASDSEDKHLGYLSNPDVVYWTVHTKRNQLIGYIILRGLLRTARHGSIELKRMGLTETNQGLGGEVMDLLKRIVFDHFKAHRLWLDVYAHNERALHVYKREGFTVEGTLRDCLRENDSFISLVILAMLEPEYRSSLKN